jgi:hypothetical protein
MMKFMPKKGPDPELHYDLVAENTVKPGCSDLEHHKLSTL